MASLYTLAIFLYGLGIRMAAPFNSKASRWLKGRRGLFERLADSLEVRRDTAWFHCASLGEYEQARPVMQAYRKVYPNHAMLVTFFSPSGYEVKVNDTLPDHIDYIPLDTRANAERFIEMVRPTTAFFVKYEFWFNHLRAAKAKGCKLYNLSGSFRPSQPFFAAWGGFFRKGLTLFEHFFVQNESSRMLLKGIGLNNVTVSGDTRFDRVHAHARHVKPDPVVQAFKGEKPILIGGSTWAREDDILTRYINMEGDEMKYIIAPHQIHEDKILKLMAHIKKPCLRYGEATAEGARDAQVLIIDNVGMLSSLYQYGHVAFIGGGFGTGLHNILEPAAFQLPVIFGPRFSKHPEAMEMIEKGGAFTVSDFKDFAARMHFIMHDPMIALMGGEVSMMFINDNRGATDTVMAHLEGQLNSESRKTPV